MGCFNYICSATNTPIVNGDKVALFLVKEKAKYDGWFSHLYSMLNEKEISKPFFGTYDHYGTIKNTTVNADNEELIDRDTLKEYKKDDDLRAYFVMMHLDAYHALKNYNHPDISVLWELKDELQTMDERSRDNPENFFKNHMYSSDDDNVTKSINLFVNITSKLSQDYDTSLTLLNTLEESETQEEFVKKITPLLDFLQVIDNMGQTGLNFNYPDFGRQVEEYSLIRELKQIGLNKTSEQINKNMEDNWLFIDVQKDKYQYEYKNDKTFTIPVCHAIYSDRMKWDNPNPVSEHCKEGYVRILFSHNLIQSCEFQAIITEEQKQTWDNSPKQLYDVLENQIIIELLDNKTISLNEENWSIEGSDGEIICDSYDYNKNKKHSIHIYGI